MVRKINWREDLTHCAAKAVVGNTILTCYSTNTFNARRWFAEVSIQEKHSTTNTTQNGPFRESLEEVKVDAVDLARELLLYLHKECHMNVIADLREFDNI